MQKYIYSSGGITIIATDDQVINGTSAPNPRSASNRISKNSYAFGNANTDLKNSKISYC